MKVGHCTYCESTDVNRKYRNIFYLSISLLFYSRGMVVGNLVSRRNSYDIPRFCVISENRMKSSGKQKQLD